MFKVCAIFLAYCSYQKGQLQQIIDCDYVQSATQPSNTCTCLNVATGTKELSIVFLYFLTQPVTSLEVTLTIKLFTNLVIIIMHALLQLDCTLIDSVANHTLYSLQYTTHPMPRIMQFSSSMTYMINFQNLRVNPGALIVQKIPHTTSKSSNLSTKKVSFLLLSLGCNYNVLISHKTFYVVLSFKGSRNFVPSRQS